MLYTMCNNGKMEVDVILSVFFNVNKSFTHSARISHIAAHTMMVVIVTVTVASPGETKVSLAGSTPPAVHHLCWANAVRCPLPTVPALA